MTGKVFESGAEKVRYYKELKKTKEKERQRQKYLANKELHKATKTEKNQEGNAECYISEATKRQRFYREQKAAKKKKAEEFRIERNRKKREYRNKLKTSQNKAVCENDLLNNSFTSRTQKHRAIKKLKQNLPATPRKRAAVLTSYLNTKNSPTVNIIQEINKIPSPEDVKTVELAEAVLLDIKTVVSETKLKRTNDARATLNIMSAVVNGENVQNKKCRIELSKKLGFNTRRMSTGKRIRTNVLTTENSAWTYTFRKTRCDALSEEIKKQVYEFWIEPENSRPTGNKTDLKRVRLGPKQYATHMKYVLEKTQTEVYLDFKEKFPNIKISQRLFEKLKPFFCNTRPSMRQRNLLL